MRAPPRPPPRRAAPRPGLWVAALGVSAALHAAALAALLFWAGREAAEEPGLPGGVALVFEDTVALSGSTDPAPGGAPPPPASPAEAPALATAPAPPPVPEPPAILPEVPPAPPRAQAAPLREEIEPPPPPVVTPPIPLAPQEVADLPPPAAVVPAPAGEPRPAPRPEVAEAVPPPPPEPPAAAARAASGAPVPPAPGRIAALPPPPAEAARPADPRPASRPADAAAVRLNAGSGALPDGSLGARAMGAVTPPAAAPGERNAPPDYPAESRRRGEEGVVRLTLRIGSDGRVEGAEVAESSGYPALDRAALDAVRRWRFRPASQAGLPVAATISTAVHFRLTQAERR